MLTFRKLLLVKKIISSGYAYEMNKKTTNTTSNKDMQTDLQM